MVAVGLRFHRRGRSRWWCWLLLSLLFISWLARWPVLVGWLWLAGWLSHWLVRNGWLCCLLGLLVAACSSQFAAFFAQAVKSHGF